MYCSFLRFKLRIVGEKATLVYESATNDDSLFPEVIVRQYNSLIQAQVIEPNGKELFKETGKKDSSKEIIAQVTGDHQYCFKNPPRINTQDLFFDFITEHRIPNVQQTYDKSHNDLIDMTTQLANEIYKVQTEMSFLEVRDQIHKQVNESTNFRVVLWAAFEAIIIIVMSIGQVFYLKRFFEVRRMI
ncbi:Transmembrane emp24 domain-containing protein 2 [Cichlidogyrus casuarinus]|uniref:Transmembrane emp24 domain-containing protein 2 n=1 Tax=Cichlidogyrus casuarinus TaxID=1844966 RepID=A0ABD2QE99_9PLAT